MSMANDANNSNSTFDVRIIGHDYDEAKLRATSPGSPFNTSQQASEKVEDVWTL